MRKMTRRLKPYKSGEKDNLFTASARDRRAQEDAIPYSKSFYHLMEQQSAIRFAEKKAEARGIEQGILEGILIAARNLKALGFSTSDIKKATGLSEKEIEAL